MTITTYLEKCADAAGVRPNIKSAGQYSSCIKNGRRFMGKPNLLPYETFAK